MRRRPAAARRRLPAGRLDVVLSALLGVAFASGVLGCGGGASPAPSWPPGAVVVVAENRTFLPPGIVVPADAVFPLVLENRDGDPHNISIRTGLGADAEVLFRHDPIVATTIVLSAGPIPAGSYVFSCEVHPQMTGTVLAR